MVGIYLLCSSHAVDGSEIRVLRNSWNPTASQPSTASARTSQLFKIMFETHVGQRPLCLLGNYVKNDKRKCTKKLVMQQVSPLNPYKGIQMQSSLFTFGGSTNQWGSFSLDIHKTNNLKRMNFRETLFKLLKVSWCLFVTQKYHPLPPENLTWNLKIMVFKWTFLFQGLIFRFHVKFRGCIYMGTLTYIHGS